MRGCAGLLEQDLASDQLLLAARRAALQLAEAKRTDDPAGCKHWLSVAERLKAPDEPPPAAKLLARSERRFPQMRKA